MSDDGYREGIRTLHKIIEDDTNPTTRLEKKVDLIYCMLLALLAPKPEQEGRE